MKVDAGVQRRVLELAEVDAELARLAHRRARLPERDKITQVEQQLRESKDALVTAQTSLGDLDRDVARLETEIEQVQARQDRDQGMLDAGNVNSKQLTELQHEVDTLARRKSSLEEDLLEAMEQREAYQAHTDRAGAQVTQAEKDLEEATHRRDEALMDVDTAEAKRTAQRESLVAEFPAELLKLYDRVRQQKGIGAGLLRAGRCGACRLELDRSALNQVREASADEVLRCEECGAILVRTPESGV